MDHGIASVVGSGAARHTVLGAPLHFLYRVEQRPSALDHTADNWLSVADAATSSGAVESITALTSSHADVIQLSTSGVVGFVTGALPVTYTFTGTPLHKIAGLTASTAYHVTFVTSTSISIGTATGSGDLTSSIAGVLAYDSSGAPQPIAPTITTTTLPDAAVSVAYAQTVAATGATPITWSLVSGSLPVWASLNTSTGAITGTPGSLSNGSFILRATNAAGSDDQALSIITTTPAMGINPTSAAVVTGAATPTITVSGGIPPYSWSSPGARVTSGTGTTYSAIYDAAGTFTITPADSVGATYPLTVTVTQRPPAAAISGKASMTGRAYLGSPAVGTLATQLPTPAVLDGSTDDSAAPAVPVLRMKAIWKTLSHSKSQPWPSPRSCSLAAQQVRYWSRWRHPSPPPRFS